MSIWQALDDGWRRTLRAPALIVGIWLGTLAIALPLALVLHEEIAGHLGSSLAADSAVAGVNSDWWNEFLAQAGGLGQTFVPGNHGLRRGDPECQRSRRRAGAVARSSRWR